MVGPDQEYFVGVSVSVEHIYCLMWVDLRFSDFTSSSTRTRSFHDVEVPLYRQGKVLSDDGSLTTVRLDMVGTTGPQ